MTKAINVLFCVILAGSYLWCQETHEINNTDGNIHLMTYGKGTPLLIINGGPGMNSNGFASLAEALAKNYRAILYDQRGTGKSELNSVNAENLTLDKMVADIEQIRNFLGIDQWVILGHSFGGMLASYYAGIHPKRVKGLILSSSGGLDLQLFESLDLRSHLSPSQRDSLQYWSSRIAEGDTTYHARYKRGQFLAPAYLYDTTFVNQVAHRLTQSNMTINRLVWQNMRESNFDCKPLLKNFQAPVLILQGEHDPLDRSLAERAHATFTNSKLVFLPKCAHYGWLESPKIYFEEIDELMKDLN